MHVCVCACVCVCVCVCMCVCVYAPPGYENITLAITIDGHGLSKKRVMKE